jgi:hypothetical protein
MKTWRSGGIAPPFLTSSLDGGECGQLHAHVALPLGRSLNVPIGFGAKRTVIKINIIKLISIVCYYLISFCLCMYTIYRIVVFWFMVPCGFVGG